MMKKILLLLMLFEGCVAVAQETIQSIEYQIGVRRNASKEWRWREVEPCEVSFILENSKIKVNDRAKSVYTTYETIEANDKRGMWNAIDEKGKHCTILIEYGYPKNKMEIEYTNTCYRYFFKI